MGQEFEILYWVFNDSPYACEWLHHSYADTLEEATDILKQLKQSHKVVKLVWRY